MAKKETIFVLLSDLDGNLRSTPQPIGYAVISREIAEDFKKSRLSYQDTYIEVEIVRDINSLEDLIEYCN